VLKLIAKISELFVAYYASYIIILILIKLFSGLYLTKFLNTLIKSFFAHIYIVFILVIWYDNIIFQAHKCFFWKMTRSSFANLTTTRVVLFSYRTHKLLSKLPAKLFVTGLTRNICSSYLLSIGSSHVALYNSSRYSRCIFNIENNPRLNNSPYSFSLIPSVWLFYIKTYKHIY